MSEDLLCLSVFPLMLLGMVVLFYLAYRFGKTTAVIDLTEDEYRVLRDAQQARRCRTSGVAKPSGLALARKSLISYHRVFRNGIFSDVETVEEKLSFGFLPVPGPRKVIRGTPAFLPFGEISGIFPIDVSVRILRAGERLETSREEQGIQIETKDLRTVVLFGDWVQRRFVPALEQAMGRRWKDLYQPDERLKGILIAHRWRSGKHTYYVYFTYLDYAKHKLLRSGPAYAADRLEGWRNDDRNAAFLNVELPRRLRLWMEDRLQGEVDRIYRGEGKTSVPASST